MAITTRIPKPPMPLKTGGRRLWRSVLTRFALAEHEKVMLLECCRTIDTIDDLVAIAAADGVVIESPQGRKAHPALTEARQQRLVLTRLLRMLGIPDDADEPAEGDDA
ncbi:terminase [Rhodococcus hoagii]|nr:terminase [Prescottella equi]